jgi:hypothetical protein
LIIVYYLGHDFPKTKIDKQFLNNKKFWIHAKNINALEELQKTDLNYFWHETDKMTLTSKNIPWCYPKNYVKNGITVLKENEFPTQKILGVCTDYPLLFRNMLKEI